MAALFMHLSKAYVCLLRYLLFAKLEACDMDEHSLALLNNC